LLPIELIHAIQALLKIGEISRAKDLAVFAGSEAQAWKYSDGWYLRIAQYSKPVGSHYKSEQMIMVSADVLQIYSIPLPFMDDELFNAIQALLKIRQYDQADCIARAAGWRAIPFMDESSFCLLLQKQQELEMSNGSAVIPETFSVSAERIRFIISTKKRTTK
jgi:hypothetical protein